MIYGFFRSLCTHDAVVAKPFAEQIIYDIFAEGIPYIFTAGLVCAVRNRVRRVYPDGIRWVRSRFSIAETADGVVTKVIFANMGIDEQKRKELEEEAENKKSLFAAYESATMANEAKSNFLARMSHDIHRMFNSGITTIFQIRIRIAPSRSLPCRILF